MSKDSKLESAIDKLSGIAAVLFGVILVVALFVGFWLQPIPIVVQVREPGAMHYDQKGAMLKLMNDIARQRVVLQQDEKRIYQIGPYSLLVKREPNPMIENMPTQALYLIESSVPDMNSKGDFVRMQLGVWNMNTEAIEADMRFGYWRNIKK